MSSELQTFKRIALEFRERFRKSRVRSDVVWNEAVRDCISRIGTPHDPPHNSINCVLCWIHGRLRDALRLENAGYVPVKERMRNSLDRLRSECKLRGVERKAYLKGVDDLHALAEKLFEDWE